MQPQSSRDWTAERPYQRFFEFIAPEADRFAILSKLIAELRLNSVVIPLGNDRHFFIFPPGKNFNPSAGGRFPFGGQSPVVLAAHYDRVAGSPGANDNSAAVFQLLKAALRLGDQRVNDWIIIFTDKEELTAGEGIRNQGSFGLAKQFKIWGMVDSRVYIFDACGTGDTFVLSGTTDYLLKNDRRPGTRGAKQIINNLREHALNAARLLRLNRVLSVPTPFSDDAGFLRAGIPALTVTMLPAGEALSLASLLRKRPEFANIILTGADKDSPDRMHIPETWRCLNGPADSHLRLTPEHYERVVRFAMALCRR
jgi:hypothetical protein